MTGSPEGLTKRDRALAELVRVRGWATDQAIDRAVAEASSPGGGRGLGAVLVAGGVISAKQLESLENAIDGRSSRTRPSTPSASRSDRTITRSEGAGGAPPSGIRRAPDVIGPYRILRELGRGGMGVVYRALDPELRREVALKVMIAGSQSTEADVERFRREAAVVARMGRHPHLVQIHDIGRDGDRLYFTMDFIDGHSAKQHVEENGPFPPRDAARIAREMAGVLALAHRTGVVHRDVKPHNILLDRDLRGFLGDFGLARDLSNTMGLTESGSAFGTPAYMSPEQAIGQASHATALSDVYSLGATLYELVCGKPPFTGESSMDIVRQVIDTDPVPPSALRAGLHRDLEVIIQKAMHKDPARRYAGSAEFEADLGRFLNGEPIHARPVGLVEKLALKARRHRAVVAVSASGLAVALGLGGWAAWRLHRSELRERERVAGLERRTREATPFILEGKSLIERSDEAHRSGGWKDRDLFARQGVETLLRARTILPESDEVRYELGRALRRAGREDEALAELTEAVRLNPRNSLAWFERGLIRVDRMSDARGHLVRIAIGVGANDVGFVPSGISMRAALWTGDAGRGDADLRAAASGDFRRVLETGAVRERAAYGEAILAFLDGNPDQALVRIDRALEDNRWFVEALRARAEILETMHQDPSAGLAEREKLFQIQPLNPEVVLDYAQSLRFAGKGAEGLQRIRKILPRLEGNPELLVRASEALGLLGDRAGSEAMARSVLGVPEWSAHHAEAVRALVTALQIADADPEALAALDRYEGAADRDWASYMRAEMAARSGDGGRASRLMRRVPRDSVWWRLGAGVACHAEHVCGNLGLVEEFSAHCIGWGHLEAYRMTRGLARLDRGDMKGALEDFEAVRALYPKFNSNLSNIAAARFLMLDYEGSIAALEESVLATPLKEEQRRAAKKMFEDRRAKLAGVHAPADAARVVEEILGALMLAALQAREPAAQGPIREATRGLLWLLQAFYAAHGLHKEAMSAADRYLTISRAAGMLYMDARVRALSGDGARALERLKEAVALGFDDGARLDGEAAFEPLREKPEYAEIRKACRN
ncbi:MAG: protein kinase [Candidatus Brocadiae bacterium]|nr:protein kinase [Candidatus Brocadiia bacterium]